jgi:D-alanyl-D-alanine carboxypeptidase
MIKSTRKFGSAAVILSAALITALLQGCAAGAYFEETPAAATTAATEPTTEEAAVAPTEPETEPVTERVTEAPAEPVAEPTAAEEFGELPQVNDFADLTLVNAANPLPADHAPELLESEDGYLYDARAVGALLAMLSGAREDGLSPAICSAYRPIAKQLELYEAKVNELILLGYERPDAEKTAATIIAYPGTSEHNLGLAVDSVAAYYGTLDSTQADTPEAQWLAANCQDYGFILRYPEDKGDVTGIIYEPWHFRYVGVDAAKEIMERGICLEEYLVDNITNKE